MSKLSLSRAIAASSAIVFAGYSVNASTPIPQLVALSMSGAVAADAMRELIARGPDGVHAFAGAITTQLQSDIASGAQALMDAMAKAKRADKKAPAVVNSPSQSLYVQFTRIATQQESPVTIARRGGSKAPSYEVIERTASAPAAAPKVKKNDAIVSQQVRELFGLPATSTPDDLCKFLVAHADTLRAAATIATTPTATVKPSKRRAAAPAVALVA